MKMRQLYRVCFVRFNGLKLSFNMLILLTSEKNGLIFTFNKLK